MNLARCSVNTATCRDGKVSWEIEVGKLSLVEHVKTA